MKIHLFDKIIHFSMQFSSVLNIFIVKTWSNSTFTNDLKKKKKFFRKMFIVTEYAALIKYCHIVQKKIIIVEMF